MPKDANGASTPAESSMGAPAGMGQIVPFVIRNRPVAVGVDGGTVVPFPSRLFDRWDCAVAGIGGSPGVTDAQLRDVFLLMVAEMSGMTVVSGSGKGD